MIKISDGINTMIVTNGAYNSMYKNMGFVEFKRTQLKGKKHITIFFEKNLI